ncbi:VOC family protein [Cellulomonas marina]|uniref:VOC domain-containing protein n=1 Tax=Cellulomonas marina TaxID=988821 RepID=A0A1I0V3P4_9CELL|nr:VOC family protein [Cellulomonas marina]GIG28297.1 hypothetical protein Cma02nite_08970 [Cellulomonas marina]SFA70700.1 hypothetical protein SAMN05421867_101124 [Cellulomonas marina]
MDTTTTGTTGTTGTTTQPPRPRTVTWWELPVDDLDRAQAFYGPVLGWTFSPFGDEAGDYLGVSSGGELVGAVFRAPDAPREVGVRVYVLVDDLEAVLAATVEHGGTVKVPRSEVGGDMGWWAEVLDPDGRWLGLCTDDAPSAA